MDRFKYMLTDSMEGGKALESLGNIKHLYGVKYDELVNSEVGPCIRYEMMKDLRTAFIKCAIIACNMGSGFSDTLTGLMGFNKPINDILEKGLKRICFSEEIMNSKLAGYGEIAVANTLCKEDNTVLLRKIICEGYEIDSEIINEPDRFDFFNTSYVESLTEKDDFLFVKNIHLLHLQPYTDGRGLLQVECPYELTIDSLRDRDLYTTVVFTCLNEAGTFDNYIRYRDHVAQVLSTLNIEVVDSLMVRPKVWLPCPASISYEQLDDIVLHCLIDKLACIY